MSLDFGFNFAPSFQKLKASRIDRFRSNIEYAKHGIQHEATMLKTLEREIAKWSDPEAYHIDSFVLKEVSKSIKTKDFRDEFVLKQHASVLRKLEETKERLTKTKAQLEKYESQFAEELKFENETFEEFRERTLKENSNG